MTIPHRKPRILGTLFAGLFALAVIGAGCGDEPVDDDGNCTPGDPTEGDTCQCSGDDCICPSTGDCAVLCVSDCNLQCAGSGSCDFECEGDCNADCTGSGNCAVEVGHGSSVNCTGSGDCDVHCNGDCQVSCPGSATCTVTCLGEAECSLTNCGMGEVVDCGNGVQICNGSC